MIQASSYRMELMMCVLTLFSISMLCYIVSDLDSPFSGFFRIDISIIVDVIYRLEVMHKMAALGFEETVCYPDSSRFTQKKYDDTEKVDHTMQIQTVCQLSLSLSYLILYSNLMKRLYVKLQVLVYWTVHSPFFLILFYFFFQNEQKIEGKSMCTVQYTSTCVEMRSFFRRQSKEKSSHSFEIKAFMFCF